MLIVGAPVMWAPTAGAHSDSGHAQTETPDSSSSTSSTSSPSGSDLDTAEDTVDILRADAEQVRVALADTEARRGEAQLALADARAGAAAAAEKLAAAERAERSAAARARRLDDEVRASAVDAYLSAGKDVPLRMLAVDDAQDAAWQATVLRSRADQRRALFVEQEDAHRNLQAERRARSATATRAEAAEQQATAVVEQLISLENTQTAMVAQVDERLDAALSEAAALAAVDQQAAAALAVQEQQLATAAAQSLTAPLPATPSATPRSASRATPVTVTTAPSSTIPPAPTAPPTTSGPTTTVPVGTVPTPVPVDVVNVGVFVVARSLAEPLTQLLAAAQGAGLSFGGSGYRDVNVQIDLRKQHCGITDFDIWQKPASQCAPPTAIPGRSMHEKGLAVDFTCAGVLIRDRASPCFTWLAANAAGFGLYNLPSEPWHWSTNGN